MFASSPLACLASLGVALSYLQLVQFLQRKQLLEAEAARKAIHIGMGPLFVLTWLWYPAADPHARYWAALIPLGISVKFALVGLGLLPDPDTVRSMSRSGDPRELLLGPLTYGGVMVLATVGFWLDSFTGIAAIALLCFGDGFAALAGRAWGGGHRLPHNPDKSWPGSLGFVVAAFVAAYALLPLLRAEARPGATELAAAVAVAAVVESLPVREWDNVTVFVAAVVVGKALFP